MEEKEKKLWVKYGQLAWQKDQSIMQTQAIVQQMQQITQDIAQLKTQEDKKDVKPE